MPDRRVRLPFALLRVGVIAALLMIGLGVWGTSSAQSPAVGALQSEPSTPTSLTVVWDDVTGATSYTIRWRLVGTAEFTPAVTAADGRHEITGLSAGRQYVVQVLAADAEGTLLARLRGRFRLTLTTPVGFAVVGASSGSLTVSWRKPVGWDPSAYELRWRRPADAPFLGSVRLAGTATSHTLTQLEDQTEYVLNLVALNDIDEKSFDVSDRGWAVDPLTLTLSAASEECVAILNSDLSWEITGGLRPYRLWVQGAKINLDTTESYRARCGSIPVDPETGESVANPTKTFSARVLDGRGVEKTAEATVRLVQLSGPELSVGEVGSSSAALTWTAPDGWAPVVYRLRWRLQGASEVLGTVDINARERSYTLRQLDGSQTYVLRLTAVHGSRLESLPDTARVTTAAALAAPILMARTAASGSVELSWDAQAASVTGWEYRQRQGNRDWGTWKRIAGGDASTVSHSLSGLTEDARYDFQLRAVNAEGPGPASKTVGAVAGLTPTLSSYVAPLSHDEMDKDGGATEAGSFVFLTDADDLTSGATSFLEIAAAEALLVNGQGADGVSQSSLLNRIGRYDYFNWFPYGDCFYSYYVTAVLPDPPAPARKLFRVRIYHQDRKCEHASLSSMRLLEGERNNPALLEWRRLHGPVVGSDGVRLLQRGVAVGGHAYRLTDRTGPTSIVVDVPVGMRLRAVSGAQNLDGDTYITYLDELSDAHIVVNPHTGEYVGPFVDRAWADYEVQGSFDLLMRFARLLASIRELPHPE